MINIIMSLTTHQKYIFPWEIIVFFSLLLVEYIIVHKINKENDSLSLPKGRGILKTKWKHKKQLSSK